jgi:hypothetical protein
MGGTCRLGAHSPEGFAITGSYRLSIHRLFALPVLLEVTLLETSEPPAYQQVARKALHLRELGMSDRAIAGRLDVTDKTIAKAIAWVPASQNEARSPRYQHGPAHGAADRSFEPRLLLEDR